MEEIVGYQAAISSRWLEHTGLTFGSKFMTMDTKVAFLHRE